MQLYKVDYIGRCKDKGLGSQAFGWVKDGWSLIFPEQVLRDWFEDQVSGGANLSTLYAILGIKQTATEDEIKAGYRRMAMQWHPDRCKDPDAHDQFIRVQKAFDTLKNPTLRAKYDAGLVFAASAQTRQQVTVDSYGYRSPLKCGYLMVDETISGKWIVVKKILAWEDISNGKQIMVADWPLGAKQPMLRWV